MGMGFGTRNVKSLYRSTQYLANWQSVTSIWQQYKVPDVFRMVVSPQMIINFFVEMGTLIIIRGQVFSYIRKTYQQFRR